MMGDDLGADALSKIAEAGIKSQLEQVEEVEVDIDANPLQVASGEVDAVEIKGKGMEMQDGLRMEEMHLQTNKVDLDVMSTMFGDVKLEQPTQATAKVVLTEQDINRAFNSDFIKAKMQGLPISVDGEPAKADVQRVDFELQDNEKIGLTAQVLVNGAEETVAFTATPTISADHHQVLLENVEYGAGGECSPELTEALLKQSSALLDLRNFELESMRLKLNKLLVAAKTMTLMATAQVTAFPSE